MADEEITKVHLSETMRTRVRLLDEALRKAGFLHFSAPPILECPEFVRLIVHARGDDYQAGVLGRTPSTQMLAVKVPPVAVVPPPGEKKDPR